MTHVTVANETTRAQVLALEQRRRQALIDVDMPTLRDIYDDLLIHIHAPGLVHTKDQLLEHTQTRRPYLDMWRENLQVRVAGDIAIMTGRLINRLRNPDGSERTMSGQVTQVMHRGADGQWRYVNFQMTPESEQMWGKLPSETASPNSTHKD